MELHSQIPGPVTVSVEGDDDARFIVDLQGDIRDFTSYLADFCVLGLLFGLPDQTAAIDTAGVSGDAEADQPVGTWSLTGFHGACAVTPEGVYRIEVDDLGALASAGVLRALCDATR